MKTLCSLFVITGFGLLSSLFLAGVLWGQPKASSAVNPNDHRQLGYYQDATGKIVPIDRLAIWEKRKKQILENVQKVMGPLPSRENLPAFDIQVSETKNGEGYVRKTLTFVAEKGDRLPVDLYLPTTLKKGEKVPGVVALHPTGVQGKRIVAGEGPRLNRQYGLELARRGYVVICPDYPSFGDYQKYDFTKDRYVSGSMKGIFNHMRCVDLLQSLPEVDPEKIATIGHSLGGHNAIFLGVFDNRVKAIVSSCGWTPFHDYYQGKLAGWTSERYMPRIRDIYKLNPDLVPFDFPELIATLAPRAFLSVSPVEDGNFDVKGVKKAIPEAKKIFSLYKAQDQLQVRYPLCDHDFPTEDRLAAYRFIDKAVDFKPVNGEIDYSAELPRIPVTEPQDALKTFRLAPGYKIEQTAAEPLLTDPVAMSFDLDGRLYVIEMRDYSEEDKAMLGQVRLLDDTDGDGKFEKSTVFVDKLSWPTAVICYDGGIFVGAAPHLYYFKDTDGDDKADIKKIVFTGFGRRNVQGMINSFRWGLDNRIHGATSTNGGKIRRPEQPESEAVEYRGRDFSFNPNTLDIRPESGGAQHGMSFDDWGRKFVCSNSDHLQMVTYDDKYAARNPYLRSPSSRLSIADDGGQAPVFRISPVEPWRIVRTRLRASKQVKGVVEGGGRPAGYFTGSTGAVIYRGDAYPADSKGLAFSGDVGSNLVHRKRLISNGVLFTGTRIDKNSEFVRSTDIWFRPVQYANAPDGTLHILDMYREVIEHPWSLPPMIKKHLDLNSGRDRGRLYRVLPENFKQRPAPQMSKMSSAELVTLLKHPNSWHRETASRVLYERQDHSVLPQLIQATKVKEPLGRLHAMYALAGMKLLTAQIVAERLQDDHPMMRVHALKLSEQFPDDSTIRSELTELVHDDSLLVKYQLAFTLGEFPVAVRAPLLLELLKSESQDSWVRFAILSSVDQELGQLLNSLAEDERFLKQAHSTSLINGMIEILARRGHQNDLAQMIRLLTSKNALTEPAKQKMFQFYLTNLSGSKGSLDKNISGQSDQLKKMLSDLMAKSRQQARDRSVNQQQRISAIQTLSVAPQKDDQELLFSLLDNQESPEIQTAALETLSSIPDCKLDSILIEQWASLSPHLRRESQEILLSKPAWAISFLTAASEGEIPKSDLNGIRLKLLQSSNNETVKKLANQILAQINKTPRASIVKKYAPAIQKQGNVERGRKIFIKSCAACHKLEGKGEEIGPNLATFKNRGKEAILINVLDPSREVTPDYLSYLIITTQGRSHTGILAAQNATTVTLKRAEGKTSVVSRIDIEEMRSSGLSLMPEGLEKEIDVEAMADLLTYLMQAN